MYSMISRHVVRSLASSALEAGIDRRDAKRCRELSACAMHCTPGLFYIHYCPGVADANTKRELETRNELSTRSLSFPLSRQIVSELLIVSKPNHICVMRFGFSFFGFVGVCMRRKVRVTGAARSNHTEEVAPCECGWWRGISVW